MIWLVVAFFFLFFLFGLTHFPSNEGAIKVIVGFFALSLTVALLTVWFKK